MLTQAGDLRFKLDALKDDFRTKLELRKASKGINYGVIPFYDLTGGEDDLIPKEEAKEEAEDEESGHERTIIDSSVRSGQEWPQTPEPPVPEGVGFVQRTGEFSLNALMGAAAVCKTPIVVKNFNFNGEDYLHVFRLESSPTFPTFASPSSVNTEITTAPNSPNKQSTPKDWQ